MSLKGVFLLVLSLHSCVSVQQQAGRAQSFDFLGPPKFKPQI